MVEVTEPHSRTRRRLPCACNACCLHAVQTRAVIVRIMNEPDRSVLIPESWEDVVAGAAVSHLLFLHTPSVFPEAL